MMDKRKWLYLIPIVVAIAGIAFWSYEETTAENVRGILTGTPCAPPCWQGITPGTVVDRQAVIRQLRHLPGVGRVWENGRAVMWRWYGNRWRGYNCVYIEWDGTVTSISLTVDFDLTVEQVIAKYGLPDAVNVVIAGIPEDQYGSMSMFYPEHGLYFHVKVLPDYAPVLTLDSVVYDVTYTVPADSLDAWLEGVGDIGLQPWPGYGELEVSGP